MSAFVQAIDEKVVNGVYSVVVEAKCRSCGHSYLLNIPEKEWLAYTQNGELIQEADGDVLSNDEREQLAKHDGFESWGEMLKFWDGRLSFKGYITHWRPTGGHQVDTGGAR